MPSKNPQHQTPTVDAVFSIPLTTSRFTFPMPEKFTTVYATATTVRVRAEGVSDMNLPQTQVRVLPNAGDWQIVLKHHQRVQDRLDDLALVLNDLGRYNEVLAANKQGPNPLTPSAIRVDDPKEKGYGMIWRAPTIERLELERHTAKMLYHRRPGVEYEYYSSQKNFVLCPTNDAWAQVQSLLAAVSLEVFNWNQMIEAVSPIYSEYRQVR